jgi:NADH-quinone oxidoreductase subunit F
MSYEPVLIAGCDDPDHVRLAAYEKRGGYATARARLKSMTPAEIVGLVKDSGLRGRGGAGFPCGMKWTFLPKDSQKPVYLVVNADESEPGTFKDRFLLERNPHLLIEGVILTAYAIGAHSAYIYLRGEFQLPYRILSEALAECRAKGHVGKKVFGTDFNLEIHLARGAGAYICGEETGLLESLEGKRGHPRNKPPFPAVQGLFDCPTIINNVETLMNVPPLLERGISWYQSLGRERNYGPKVWCVSGHVKRPGIYETALGITMEHLLEEVCGGVRPGHRFKAAVPGGCSCGVLKADEFHARLDFDALRDFGSSLGTGGVMAWDETVCVPDALLNFSEFFAEESCGQCTPCRQGTAWAAGILHRLVGGHGMEGDLEEVRRIARGFSGTTICALADAAAIPIQSYLTKFPEEFEHHLRTGACDLAQPAAAASGAGGH